MKKLKHCQPKQSELKRTSILLMIPNLGEAFYVQGNKSIALENYTKAFKLDPSLESAKKMIQELK